jgi:tyrosyl-tRNA synthetase
MWPVSKENLQEVWAALKMSKSKPDTCIFIHDSPEEIKRKVNKAFCPEKEVDFNPLIDWLERLIFPVMKKLKINRPKKFGGTINYSSVESLKEDFKSGILHPADLKPAVAESLIILLKPARDHFSKGKPKKYLDELNKLMKITK